MGNLVVGFSVDYTIHLGHMFVAAGREHDLQNSLDRFSFAIRKMGGTVVGGRCHDAGRWPLHAPMSAYILPQASLLMVTTIFLSLLALCDVIAAGWALGRMFSFRPLSELKRMVFKHGIFMGDTVNRSSGWIRPPRPCLSTITPSPPRV